jgi:glutamate-1-semialdehyde aminotransferase
VAWLGGVEPVELGSFDAHMLESGRNAAAVDIARHASIFWMHRRADDGASIRRPDRIPAGHADWYRRFFHAALKRGGYLPPSPYEVCFLSLAHDDLTLALGADALVDAAMHPEAT